MRLAESDWVIRRDNLIAALEQCRKNGAKETGRKYFIWYRRRAYSPKDVREILQNKPKNTFSGGDSTNRLFYDFGFTVVRGVGQLAKHRESAIDCGSDPSGKILLTELNDLFRQRWEPLDNDHISNLSDQPGVYMLAYTHKEILDTPLELRDIFYVGMSTTSLRKRLRQFLDGIEDGGHHSGAKRFFVRWAAKTPYRHLNPKKTGNFLVVTCPFECAPEKSLRTPADLRMLGMVAALEYFTLAKIKDGLGLEPPLNKK